MPKVLLVDDEPDMLFVWRHILTNASYTVRVAADGLAALDQLRAEPVQLVITDWMMPRMNGAELCRAIRADQELCSISLLVFTAVSRSSVHGTPLWDEWLVKPASRDHVLAAVARLCKRK